MENDVVVVVGWMMERMVSFCVVENGDEGR